ncbi:MAG: 50S ribosomal protein L30 [Candidatus Altiarchaeales archaeon]|nr:MAG: 50S ribosomal protein L30 [Candidatus Altiarchaeales archaeon]RLI95218.1 MAG: 50S ribosomal protein L30 [Candidatus Altiarchaeales archaeon]RLI95252.1 MAG: 50S ribosomal protein L30 [Candidatus Altiarchaeales archaeon]HDO82639.1 50S ribosomal protein L30 [Candidatus Altiarchaeales archaeon]HEX55288.1 50S ribosomal protein L30 [Candidatus Altiarchaeales archaeon]
MKEKKDNKEKDTEGRKRLAVIRVRGRVHVRRSIQDTLKMLNLHRVNHCVIIDDRRSYIGMLKKAKDYITWGEINKDTFKKLLRERGRLIGNKRITDEYIRENTNAKNIEEFAKLFMNFKSELGDIPGLKPVFRLRPPKKGYERKGIKKPFSIGGVLGYRGEKINELLERMI